jgi:phosphatidylserine/phosphatidylglycerophosphate/cardiolipin synthase-like enzyme
MSGWSHRLAALLLTSAGCFPALPDATTGAPAPRPADGGAASLLVEPDDGVDPVLDIIRGAQRTVHVEMYLLTDDGAIAALTDASGAGRDVRVILEPHPYQADGQNQAAYDRLTAAGANVAWASERFALTHAKLVVADGRRAAVMTLNLTHAGLAGNREYVVVDDDAADVGAAEAIFAGDFSGDFVGAAAAAPPAAGRLLASPAGARQRIAGLLAGATRSIALEMEELSDGDMIGALQAAAARGAAVSVVLPGDGRSAATDAAARALADAGASVRALASPEVHAKAIVADGTRLYVGSINLTAASLDANREFGLLLDQADAVARVARTIAGDWARGGDL